jgi:hypothetical protein
MSDLVPRRFQPLVIASLVLMLIVLALGNFNKDDDNGGVVPFIVTVVVSLIAAWLLWRYVYAPRAGDGRSAANAGVVVGVLSVLLGIEYWTGLAFAFAPVAVALGVVGREAFTARSATTAPIAGGAEGETAGRGPDRDDPRTRATAALVLGWLGLLLATLVGLVDSL